MKITDIETYVVDAFRTNFVFVRIYTDEGITGVGEGTLEYKENAFVGAVEDIRRCLLGKNPLQIEDVMSKLYRDSYWRDGAVLQSALSAIEIALWDIKGKYYNAPIMDLLGGQVRAEIKIYANGWFAGAKKPEDFAKKAEIAVSKGIRSLKWDPFGSTYMHISREELSDAVACVEAVRSAVGNSVDLLIEAHGRFNIESAIRISHALKPFDPMFFEEPTPPDSLDALAEVHKKAAVPIAAGERVYSIYRFRELLEKRCVDFAQPDVSHCGGIMSLKKMAAMAEASYVSIAPHNPSGPVANAATLQLAGNLMNFCILEIMVTDVPWRKQITNEVVRFHDGCLEIPQRPGHGVDLCVEECLQHPFREVDLRHYKGNLTDIRPPEACFYFSGIEQ